MPIAHLSILEGRSPELKARLIENVARAIADSLDAPLESVRVLVQEYPPSHWSVGTRTMAQRRPAAASPDSASN
ncbi:tautomerase family protein [Ramlibacter sp. AW1]|uniref:Tautomerase family protein n=1 Tax=Ramlibacter aurantiacus TaxID=2801330 RepID=A0A936ZYW3_9BURK|nr:tautomerase family protein [Ramlibacter aurantiacus]MBL0422999.1 tautomerase family protein [Ramlibacter aurantiacus]